MKIWPFNRFNTGNRRAIRSTIVMPIDQVKKDESKPKGYGFSRDDKRESFYFYKSDSRLNSQNGLKL
jgi:hypothetical protein